MSAAISSGDEHDISGNAGRAAFAGSFWRMGLVRDGQKPMARGGICGAIAADTVQPSAPCGENLGLDCRYCHSSVTESSFAGVPPTKNVHDLPLTTIWRDAPMLEPVRQSWYADTPLHWTRVHDLADYVYFDHSIHVAKGVGCTTCHGQVDQMPLMYQHESLQMRWCLNCHRHPEDFVRPRDQVFSVTWQCHWRTNQEEMGKAAYQWQSTTLIPT